MNRKSSSIPNSKPSGKEKKSLSLSVDDFGTRCDSRTAGRISERWEEKWFGVLSLWSHRQSHWTNGILRELRVMHKAKVIKLLHEGKSWKEIFSSNLDDPRKGNK